MGDASNPSLRKCRERAPSHSFGRVWTPDNNRPGSSYIVDNGAFTSSFDAGEWVDLLDKAESHPWPPDFVVLPDVYGDAEGTLERHREHVDAVLSRGLRPAAVMQPGMNEEVQVRLAERIGADVIFVGGPNRWKRTMGEQIVDAAHKRGMAVHIGNPGVPNGLRWACRIGADSLDTSSVVASEAYYHLDELEGGSSRGSLKKSQQSKLGESA
jgi:hypothetical protein